MISLDVLPRQQHLAQSGFYVQHAPLPPFSVTPHDHASHREYRLGYLPEFHDDFQTKTEAGTHPSLLSSFVSLPSLDGLDVLSDLVGQSLGIVEM